MRLQRVFGHLLSSHAHSFAPLRRPDEAAASALEGLEARERKAERMAAKAAAAKSGSSSCAGGKENVSGAEQ